MASVRIKGGPELKARLEAVANSGPDIQDEWAHLAADRIQGKAPVRTGRLRQSVRADRKGDKAVVRGAFWGIILDRGSKAHAIEARKAKALQFEWKGRTVFAKKVTHRRMARRPFITEGAQTALADSRLSDQIIQAWNRRRTKSGFRKFTL